MNLKVLCCKIFRIANVKGRNNKIIICKNGKEKESFFLPKGLYIRVKGNNNICKICLPQKYENTEITILDDNNIFEIETSTYSIRNARFKMQDGGIITIGNNCFISGNFFAICYQSYETKHKITIGNNVFFAQDVILRCGDGHTVIDTNTKLPLNEPQDIIINDNVWITSRCILLKNTNIPEGSIVATNSVVNKRFKNKNILIGGSPAKVLKQNITWDKRSYCNYVKDNEKIEEVL